MFFTSSASTFYPRPWSDAVSSITPLCDLCHTRADSAPSTANGPEHQAFRAVPVHPRGPRMLPSVLALHRQSAPPPPLSPDKPESERSDTLVRPFLASGCRAPGPHL